MSRFRLGLLVVLFFSGFVRAVTPTDNEFQRCRDFVARSPEVWSFNIAGRRVSGSFDGATDEKSGLAVRVQTVQYKDFPTVEWTVFVKNTSDKDSEIIENLQVIDTAFSSDSSGEFLLHHNTGSPCTPTDYEPHETKLGRQTVKQIATTGGRSTNSDLPFFNIEFGGGGAIVALGWPGQWAATFSRDDGENLRVVAGQELTHFRLHSGEEVRTPLVVVQLYQGDATRAQNVWRQWMIAHNMPHSGGKPPPPMVGACSSHQAHEMIYATEEQQNFFIDRYVEERLHLDYWWMDAGWYPNNGDWPNVGTWEVDAKRFPRGLRAITDHARGKGIKSIVWFEPERVNPGTWLYEHHPEWQLGKAGGDRLLNLGNPDARNWWLEHVDKLIVEQGIDLYRNDFNIDPLPFWRGNDAEDRQGITEIRYVEGFLSYWDELRKRHPDMLIDTCASGGRRNDLETLRRAVPLLRSDYILEPLGQQNHTFGIASWIPYYGTGENSPDPYVFRSQICPWNTCVYDMRNKQIDYAALRQRHAEREKIVGYMLKDFYPLTPYAGGDQKAWVAWEFHDAQKDEGVVQSSRRAECGESGMTVALKGITGAAYEVTDIDDSARREMTGAELRSGLLINAKQHPEAAIMLYHRVR